MSRKISLRLVSSPQMSEAKEANIIRFPRRAREYFGFSNSCVVLGKGTYQVELRVKSAYKADVRRLARMISQGKIAEDEAGGVGFVTRAVQDRIRKKEGANPWISEGFGAITVGADPEFGLINDSELLVRGNDVLPHNGPFGSDGPGAEVRPDPSRNHITVVNNITSILSNPPAGALPYKWVGGATFNDETRSYWFGGHIHLGRPSIIPTEMAGSVYCKIAKVLDHLVALPLVKLDTPRPHLRRNGCKYGYGKAGQFDTFDASASIRVGGDGDRFEYRVLSGLWLTHPALARIIIGTTKAVAETVYGRVGASGLDEDWVAAPASRKGLLKTFGLKDVRSVEAIINNAKASSLTPELLEVWEKQLKELDCYEDYAPEVDAFIALIRNADSEDFTLDLKENWLEGAQLVPSGNENVRRALEAIEET